MSLFKIIFLTLITLVISTKAFAGFITQGEQFFFNFDSSVFNLTSISSSDGAIFTLNFSNSFEIGSLTDPYSYNGYLELGESIQLDFYENIGNLSPFQTTVIEGTDSEVEGLISSWGYFPSLPEEIPWIDLEGSIVFTVLSGEVAITSPKLRISRNGTEYSANLSTTTTVPLPSSLLLLVSPIALFFINVKIKRIIRYFRYYPKLHQN